MRSKKRKLPNIYIKAWPHDFAKFAPHPIRTYICIGFCKSLASAFDAGYFFQGKAKVVAASVLYTRAEHSEGEGVEPVSYFI